MSYTDRRHQSYQQSDSKFSSKRNGNEGQKFASFSKTKFENKKSFRTRKLHISGKVVNFDGYKVVRNGSTVSLEIDTDKYWICSFSPITKGSPSLDVITKKI